MGTARPDDGQDGQDGQDSRRCSLWAAIGIGVGLGSRWRMTPIFVSDAATASSAQGSGQGGGSLVVRSRCSGGRVCRTLGGHHEIKRVGTAGSEAKGRWDVCG